MGAVKRIGTEILTEKLLAADGPDPRPCFVYILLSDDGGDSRTYIGWTNDLERRLAMHNGGRGAKSTRGRKWRLIYTEKFPTRFDAMSREWQLKRDRKFRNTIRDNCTAPG